MKTKIDITRTSRFLSTLLLAWPALALAAIPSGQMVFELVSDNQIYDLSAVSDCETVEGVTLCLDVNMVPDGSGKYTGSASFDFQGDITGTLTGPASGSAKGTLGGTGKGKLMFSGTGNLDAGFGIFASQVTVNCSGAIDGTGFLASTCSVKVRIEGGGSGSAKAMFSDQLNALVWTLTIDVLPVDAKKFAGTGTDSLGYSYTVSGTYSSKSATSRVKATGLKDTSSSGAQVQLKNLTAGGSATAKLKVQGYKATTDVQLAP
jgi:hypothetical protein